MPVSQHAQQPATKGYYSKIINRQIVTSAVGATSFVLWEQVIPPGGYRVLLMSADPKVIYPDGSPEPVIWEDKT